MKRILLSFIPAILAIISFSSSAQDRNYGPNEEYLRKSFEAIDEYEYDKAYEFVSQQLTLTPDNVDALVLRVKLGILKEEFRQALVDINRAIKVNNPRQTKVASSTLYWLKGSIYRFISDDAKVLECDKKAYELSRKDNPDEFRTIAFDYAQRLYEADLLDEADSIYRELLSLDETDCGAMVGLSRNLMVRCKYDDAIRLLLKAIRIGPNYGEAYRFLAHAYDSTEQTNKAVDAAIEYIERTEEPDFTNVSEIFVHGSNYAIASLRSHIKNSGKPAYFRIILGEVLQESFRFEESLKEYISLENDEGEIAFINYEKGTCYRRLGMLEPAIHELTLAIEADREDYSSLCERGICYRLMGDYAKAISDFSAAIEIEPTHSFPYYQRGWCQELSGSDRGALEDYDIGLELDPDYPYLNLYRGLLQKKMGDQDKARKDFEAVLQKDTVATDGSCTHFALAELGREAEAVQWIQRIIDDNPRNFEIIYDEACLYARIGRSKEALDCLEEAFEKGLRDFAHIGNDPDLDSLREMPQFKEIVSKYRSLHQERIRSGAIPLPGSGATAAKDVIYFKS